MKRINLLQALFVGASMLVSATLAQAATISFNPLGSSVSVGQTFQVTLVGRDFTEGVGGTYGGGVSIAWDSSLLSLNGYDTSVFGGDQLLATSNTNTVLDNGTGELRDLSVASFFIGVPDADFDIAVLTFTALAPGVSQLSTEIGLFTSGFENIWTDASEFTPIALAPTFGAGSVTVVPEPGASLLLGLGLAGLASVRRRA